MNNIDNTIKSTVSTLDDLSRLSSPELAPLLQQLSVYIDRLTRINSTEKDSSRNEDDLPALLNIIREHIRYHFQSKFEINSFEINSDTFALKREEINKIITILPTVLEVIDSFKFAGKIRCVMNDGRLSFQGPIEFSQKIREIREKIYKLTRELLAKRSILTFDLKDSGNKFDLVITVDYSVGSSYRLITLPDDLGMDLVIDKLFDSFKLIKPQTDPHTVIRVSDRFSVDSSIGVPDLLDNSTDLFCFNFLFRPVSLIIPKGGKIFSPLKDERKVFIGSGNSVTGWDINTYNRRPKYYLDLFSIFNS